MIIGLTGKNGAGKGEVANILKKMGYGYTSLSDVIRDQMRKDGVEITRENLITYANKLRQDHGSSYLAKCIFDKLHGKENVIVDSIRNPFEVETLRERKDFFLITIMAEPEIRFERIKNRGRENDPVTYEKFIKIDAAEAGSNNPTTQQLNRTIDMADALIENNGSLEELEKKVKQILKTLKVINP